MLTFTRKIYNLFWITRITIIVPILLVGICSFIIVDESLQNKEIIYLILIPCLLAAGGFVLNDIFDLKKDKLNSPNKPLPSKMFSVLEAYKIFSVFFLLTILLIIFVNSLTLYLLFSIAIILTLSYSLIKKYNGVLGNLVTAILSTIPWLAPALYVGKLNLIILPTIACFCLIFSREILLDIKDFKGDKEEGFFTLPIKLGTTNASFIAYILLVIMNLIAIYYGLQNSFGFLYFLILFMVFFIPSLILLYLILSEKVINYINYICHFGKIQFLVGVLSLIVLNYSL